MKKRKSSRKNMKSVEAKGKSAKESGSSLCRGAGKAILNGLLFGISKEAAAGYFQKISENGVIFIEWVSQFLD